ncbi:MAG: choline ABC transporter permease [Firmicutes bacterium HGW-Firmicutes-9]|nr:MAG: choline ABC transporter permease [Firmicutes bacterium HGW-Firmicutes-9]
MIDLYGESLLRNIGIHLLYVFASVSIGFVLGLTLGILLYRSEKYAKIILPVLSVFNTIPGIVFIGILFLYLGMKPATVIIALSIYAMFPVLKNTFVGLTNVERRYIEAARGCGMNNRQILFRVELPLAIPTIIGGLRMATIYTVSWSVLAAMIGLGGLGEFIYQGININRNDIILLGAIPAAVLAIALGLLIDVLQRKVTPRGIRKELNRR